MEAKRQAVLLEIRNVARAKNKENVARAKNKEIAPSRRQNLRVDLKVSAIVWPERQRKSRRRLGLTAPVPTNRMAVESKTCRDAN